MRRAFLPILLWLLAGTALPAAEPGIAAFAAMPMLERPMISPDGRRYACLLSTDGQRTFVIAPFMTVDGQPRKVGLGAGSDLIDW